MEPFLRRIAIRKQQITDPTYRLFHLEWITKDAMLVEGSATTPFKSGPRKGEPKYVGTRTKAVVTKAELDAERILYECETGKCWRCLGEKQVQVQWGVVKGPGFKQCKRCTGSGQPPVTAQEVQS